MWSVEWGVLIVKCEAQSVECGVESVKYDVESVGC